jgi:hypothetical protein
MRFKRQDFTREGLNGEAPAADLTVRDSISLIKRPLLKHSRIQFEAVLERAGPLASRFERRDWMEVSIIQGGDWKRDRRFGGLLVGAVHQRMYRGIGTFANHLTLDVTNVGLIPKRNEEGAAVVLDLSRQSQDYLLWERSKCFDAAYDELGTPDCDRTDFYTGRSPAVPVGEISGDSTEDEREEFFKAFADVYPGQIELGRARAMTKDLRSDDQIA